MAVYRCPVPVPLEQPHTPKLNNCHYVEWHAKTGNHKKVSCFFMFIFGIFEKPAGRILLLHPVAYVAPFGAVYSKESALTGSKRAARRAGLALKMVPIATVSSKLNIRIFILV